MPRIVKVSLFILLSILSTESINAQALGKALAKRILTRQIEKKLPDMINDSGKVESLNISKLDISGETVRLKGDFFINFSEKIPSDEAVKFKSSFSLSSKNPTVRKLKVSIPGDRFLFFRRYRSLI